MKRNRQVHSKSQTISELDFIEGIGPKSKEILLRKFRSVARIRAAGLVYVNRQDDAGDPGLRAAKESWRPVMMLPKFNVTYIK